MRRNDNKQMTVLDYLAIIWRRRGIAMLAVMLFACATFIVFIFVPKKYAAEAVFERSGDAISARTDSKIPENFKSLKPVLKLDLTGPEAIRAALEDLGYVDRLEHDVQGLLTPDASADLAAMVGQIQQGLSAKWLVKSENVDRVAVNFTGSDPVLAQKLPNRLVLNYIETTRRGLIEQLDRTCQYMEGQVADTQAKLEQIRQDQITFRLDHPDVLPSNPLFFADRLNQIDADLVDFTRRREILTTHMSNLQSLMKDNQQVARKPNPAYQEALTTVNKYAKALDEMVNAQRKTDKHPDVIAARQSLTEAEERLALIPMEIEDPSAQPGAAPNYAVQLETERLRGELARLESDINQRTEDRRRFETAQANMMPAIKDYERLTANLTLAENELRGWQKSLASVQIARDAERGGTRTNLEVVSLASTLYKPSWPPLWLVFGLAIGGGLVFGGVVSVLHYRLAKGFDTPDEASETLGAPLLGAVGAILSPAARRMRALNRYAVVPVLASLLIAITALAATAVVMSVQYPGKYANLLEKFSPVARSFWTGAQGLLGAG